MCDIIMLNYLHNCRMDFIWALIVLVGKIHANAKSQLSTRTQEYKFSIYAHKLGRSARMRAESQSWVKVDKFASVFSSECDGTQIFFWYRYFFPGP